MNAIAPRPVHNLAQRALQLRQLKIPGSVVTIRGGRELTFRFQISPGRFGRVYQCLLRVRPDAREPDLFVMSPDLIQLSGAENPPHIYRHTGAGTKLCLWWPKQREWLPQMNLADTFIPWTQQWLWYFEDWLTTRDWAGGGEHPEDAVEQIQLIDRFRRIKDKNGNTP